MIDFEMMLLIVAVIGAIGVATTFVRARPKNGRTPHLKPKRG